MEEGHQFNEEQVNPRPLHRTHHCSGGAPREEGGVMSKKSTAEDL
jgi:hypothetical protein